MKNGDNNTCPLTNEIVSYMYGELGGKAEYDFETHLADCTVCTDEFAAVSDPRFSVFEWKREAFDPLPTPSFQLPYEAPVPTIDTGLIAAVKAWGQGLRVPLAVAAAVILVIGIGLIVFVTIGKKEESVAVSETKEVIQPSVKLDEPAATLAPPVTDPQPNVAEIKRYSKQTAKPTQTSTVRQKRVFQTPSVVAEKAPSKVQKAPALTAYQDNDDDSLRLAELFDEVGG